MFSLLQPEIYFEQASLNIPASTTATTRSTILRPGDTTSFFLPQAESTAAGANGDSAFDEPATSPFFSSPDASRMDGSGRADSPSTPRQNNSAAQTQTLSNALAHIAQVRTLILGM